VNHLFLLIARHRYLLTFLVVLSEAIGLPVPAALALVAAGAGVASKALNAPLTLGLAFTAMLTGDTLLFVLGRYMGWSLLAVLCKLSVNPESCVLRSAESFYKRGKLTLLFAKFVPGVNTMAPPLAGSMKMRPLQFLGFLFHDFLEVVTRGLQTAGHVFGEVLLTAAAGYTGYRVWIYRKNLVYKVVPRVQVEELARKLASDEADKVLLVDVRSHGYYDPETSRIKGSIRIEPNNLHEELKILPKDKDIYLYCT